MNKLLDKAIKAHGGFENWTKIKTIKVRAHIGGLLWKIKGQPELLDDIYAVVSTKKQAATYIPVNEEWQITFEDNNVTKLLDTRILEDLPNPRKSFSNHTKETQWTTLQTFYFASYAMWMYLNTPFVFANPDFKVKEIEPWQENEEEWRRLEVTFPNHIHTHSRNQIYYIDKSGLIRRHDYNVEIIGNGSSAHYLYDYNEISGIKIPTKREVFTRMKNNTSIKPEPILVSILLTEFEFN